MKIYVQLTKKEMKGIKNIAMDFEANEKTFDLMNKDQEWKRGPVSFTVENNTYEINIGEACTTYILKKIKGLTKFIKGFVKGIIAMCEGLEEEVFGDAKGVHTIEGIPAEEYIEAYYKEDEEDANE